MSVIEDQLAIAAVIYRYSRAMDEKRWGLMDDVFTEDATAELGGALFPKGRKQVVATIKAAIDCCSATHHTNTNIEATIEGDRAHVFHRVRAWHRGKGAHADVTYEALGHYIDEFVRTPAGWRIKKRIEETPVEMGDVQTFFAEAIEAFAAVAKQAG